VKLGWNRVKSQKIRSLGPIERFHQNKSKCFPPCSSCPTPIGWVNAQSLIRVYAYNADENKVTYGQTIDVHKTTNLFQVESITGRHMAMDICSICFSVFSVVSLFVFFYIEKRKSKRSQWSEQGNRYHIRQ
jgi:hypothetical protein